MLKLDGYKVVSHNGKTATLVHPDGHEMKIALGAVSRLQRNALKDLAKKEEKPKAKPTAQKRMHYDKGGTTAAEQGAGIGQDIGEAGSSNLSDDEDQGSPGPQAPVSISINAAPQAPQAPPAATPVATGPAAGMFGQPAVQQAQGNAQQRDVDIAKAKQAEKLNSDYIDERQQLADRDRMTFEGLEKTTGELRDNLKDIDPKHYTNSMSGGQKAATALGLFLGGIGAGKTGGPNYAYDYLNKQIDRDIDAQKNAQENTKTIYGAYKHLYGESVAANSLAKVSMNDIYLHKAQLLAAQLGTPQAIANYNQLQGKLGLENMNLYGVAAHDVIQRGVPPTGHASGGKSSQGSKQKSQSPLGDIQPLLKPNAQSTFDSSQYNPQARPDYADLQTQYKQAQMADQALANLGPTFDKLASHTTNLQRGEHKSFTKHLVAFRLLGIFQATLPVTLLIPTPTSGHITPSVHN